METFLRIGDFTGDSVTASEHESLADVASRMRYNDVGCVAVLKGARLVGLLTERDITRAIADGAGGDETPVADYMTPGPPVIPRDAAATDAARIMVDTGLSHIPVMNEHGFLGMASLEDVLVELFWLRADRAQEAG